MLIVSDVLFIAGIIAALLAMWCLDRALLIEYRLYNDNWVKDGKPNGYFWYPEESLWEGDKYRYTGKMYYKLTFITPIWVKHDHRASKYVLGLRFLSLLWSTLFVAAFLLHRMNR